MKHIDYPVSTGKNISELRAKFFRDLPDRIDAGVDTFERYMSEKQARQIKHQLNFTGAVILLLYALTMLVYIL
ncbi:MAG TPA: hypothetical protein VGC07_08080 [Granulicella sp.]